MFDSDLLLDLREWKKNEERIIPQGDFNQHIYGGKLQEAFMVENIGSEEQFRKLYDKNVPLSHASGSRDQYVECLQHQG